LDCAFGERKLGISSPPWTGTAQFFQVAIDGAAINFAAMEHPEPLHQVGAGSTCPFHCDQLGTILIQTTLAVKLASRFGAPGTNLFNLDLCVKCLVILRHLDVLPVVSHQFLKISFGSLSALCPCMLTQRGKRGGKAKTRQNRLL
jgi:hypothetical protein